MNEWDTVWKRNNMQRIISWGRNIYNKQFAKVLLKDMDINKEYCEFGCGTSSLSLSLCNNVHRFTGFDYSEVAIRKSIETAQSMKINNAVFYNENCEKLFCLDESYDIVWSQGLIEHFENPIQVVKEHIRVCKKGGVVLISVPYKYSYMYLWYLATRPKLLRRFWAWTDQCFYTKKKFISIMEELKINNYKIYNMKPFIFGIIILEVRK